MWSPASQKTLLVCVRRAGLCHLSRWFVPLASLCSLASAKWTTSLWQRDWRNRVKTLLLQKITRGSKPQKELKKMLICCILILIKFNNYWITNKSKKKNSKSWCWHILSQCAKGSLARGWCCFGRCGKVWEAPVLDHRQVSRIHYVHWCVWFVFIDSKTTRGKHRRASSSCSAAQIWRRWRARAKPSQLPRKTKTNAVVRVAAPEVRDCVWKGLW